MMTVGCGDGKEAAKAASIPVDLSSVRCPEADARYRKTFTSRAAPPANGEAEVVKDAVDDLRLSEDRKGRAGMSVLADYDACRKGIDAVRQQVAGKPTS